ncbi:Fip1 [Kluyveromyces lactis]|nr:Fip1 [Kluyveromyces lactis]
MSSEDEDDKFLYSDEEDSNVVAKQEGPALKRQKIEETPKVLDHGVPEGDTNEVESEASNQDSASDDDDSSDSDSDVEIIIGTGNDTSKIDSGKSQISAITDTAPLGTADRAIAAVAAISDVVPVQEGSILPEQQQQQQQQTIDLNPDAQFDGKPIVQIDPEILKEKPWRQPGANISDYFNYGFNEQTWMEYLHRQEHLTKEYNPQKILMNLLALQQQGKLNDPGSGQPVQNTIQPPPPPMGLPPMFGGFPGFPFPGMMNNMQNQNVSSMNNINNNNNLNDKK